MGFHTAEEVATIHLWMIRDLDDGMDRPQCASLFCRV